MKVFIPNDIKLNIPERELFILTRPFRAQEKWVNNVDLLKKWGIGSAAIQYTDAVEDAAVILIPYPINYYFNENKGSALARYNKLALKWRIKGYGYVSGDWGHRYQEFEQLTYFRMGGVRTKLSERNQGFPVSLSDQYKRIYGSENIQIRKKQKVPIVGFCGHASFSLSKLLKESLKIIIENSKHALSSPANLNWDPIFPSAYHRAKILRQLEQVSEIKTNFIYRQHYRAGAKTEKELHETTLQYYDNIHNSDYVVCLRGGGNFSVRLYETLMMGRIPVFVNTDCLLPFPEKINWHNHVVWIDWSNRQRIGECIWHHFNQHNQLQFRELQVKNRALWKEVLSVNGMFNLIK